MNGNSTTVAQRLQSPRRALMLIGALAITVIWSVVLAAPDTPTADSPEAGYSAALVLHARQIVATVDLVNTDAATRDAGGLEALETIRDGHQALADQADALLEKWGIERTAIASDPVAWMGHVIPGEIPGTIDALDLEAIGESDQVLAGATGALVASADGAMLMARAAADLTDDADVEAIAAQDLELDQDLRDRAQSLRIDTGLGPVAAISAMTTDPGDLDHGGNPVDSIGQALEEALRLAPFLIAIALAVTGLAPVAERRPSPGETLAGVASLAAGFLHLGLIGPHYEEAPISGAFFVAVAVAQAAIGVALLASPDRDLLRIGALVSGAVTVVFAIFRLISPPGLVGPATVDLTGIVTVALQIVVVAGWVLAQTTEIRPRPLAE